MRKVCIIGLGNMGKSMFNLLKKSGYCSVFGADKGDNLNEILKKCDTFIVAVKPQDFGDLCKSIEIDLKGKLVISIMAGMSIAKISKGLKTKNIVRVMPNLALKVGLSVSGWMAGKNVSKKDKEFVKKLLAIFGTQIEVNKEEKINQITALSGSGPAYFYYLAEIIETKAKDFGFKDMDARKLAEATLIGSAELMKSEGVPPSELKKKVTSKGGTTESALKYMQKNKLDKTVKKAIDAACKRAKDLSK